MSNRPPKPPIAASELRAVLNHCRAAVVSVSIFSGLINVLALTSSIYMLQLYDRVIPSHSVATLVALTILMLMLFTGYGVLDMVRTRVMSRIGLRMDRLLRERVFGLVLALPLRTRGDGDGLQPVRDLDQLRSFLASPGPIALFDMPWMPFYLGLVCLLHPWLGLIGMVGAFVLICLTIVTEIRSRTPTQSASSSAGVRQAFALAGYRNAEVISALGMQARMSALWSQHNEQYLINHLGASDVAATYSTLSKVLRLMLQSAVLGLGAYLVIDGQATGGVMIAASILVSRALAPIEVAIAHWRSFLAARHSKQRLSKLLQSMPERPDVMDLPGPAKSLTVEGLCIVAPGHQRLIVQNASFSLQAGAGLGVVGPSASGKSTLVRALVGAWTPLRGTVRLDGAALHHWSRDALGAHIGYLPQDIELFDGSVASNIARFDPNSSSAAIIAAAQTAGAHEMILQLPEGYETNIGESGAALSAGQRQRIALARALYGDPFFVVLDEPNSNLDAEGDIALTRAISSVRERRGIIIVVAHRPSALASLDQLLVMGAGQVQAFGSKDELLFKPHMPAAQSSAARLKVIADNGQAVG